MPLVPFVAGWKMAFGREIFAIEQNDPGGNLFYALGKRG